ncbi:hemicentin-1-like [Haliotis rufescens]|uniref:hemicentin-1-like n=1 Tax=Haliotis rufescens TaxID=6454 RepID=UPI00201F6060|nr:hemicentin-1-like [Haliotis rufescens]
MPLADKLVFSWIFLLWIVPSYSLDVNGGVSEWLAWSGVQCDQTCGNNVTGISIRQRLCDDPLPEGSGMTCEQQGNKLQDSRRIPCNLTSCGEVINGNYSEWSEWEGICPSTCGVMVQLELRRNRSCDKPPPMNGGSCADHDSEIKNGLCEGIARCPDAVNGSYESWGAWVEESCPETCGINVASRLRRTRTCNEPLRGGLPCQGPNSQEKSGICKDISPCKVHGGVSEWGEWDKPRCNVICGENATGTSLRLRRCNNPIPEYGGLFCNDSLQDNMLSSCGLDPCLIDSGLSEWGEWDDPECPETCGRNATMKVTRNRTCTNPVPQFGSANCSGHLTDTETRNCNHTECPMHGRPGLWSTWIDNPCPATCGPVTTKHLVRKRNCSDPEPAYGGRNCTDPLLETKIGTCGGVDCEDPVIPTTVSYLLIGISGSLAALLVVAIVVMASAIYIRKKKSSVEDNEPPSEPSETEPSEVGSDVDHDTTISSISLDLKLWEPRNPDVFQSQEELVAIIDIPLREY